MRIKGLKTKEAILQAAMNCIADVGLEATTFQAIADHAKLSQPLVVYHLKTRENIFFEVFQSMLDTSLDETVAALANAPTAAEKLEIYAEISLKFFRSHPAVAICYLSFYYLSSFNPRYRAMNDKLKSEATERILTVLALGMGSGEFKIANPLLTSKLIHTQITGLLLNLATETSKFSDEELLSELKKSCFRLATSN